MAPEKTRKVTHNQVKTKCGKSHDLNLAQNLQQFGTHLRQWVQTLKQAHTGEYFAGKAMFM